MTQDQWIERIRASINKYFDSNKSTYTLYVEGMKPSIPSVDSWAELRINGPEFKEVTKGEWEVDLSVDIMCRTKETTQLYLIDRISGLFASIMNDILVTVQNTDYWFCLHRQSVIKTIPWGIVQGDINTYSTSVMSDYKGAFKWPLST